MSTSERRKRTGCLPAARCFEEDEALVRVKAHDRGMSVGEFMLTAALKRQTISKIDAHIINELRRLGSLQKHLFTMSGGKGSDEYSSVLVELTETIKLIGS
ncbi:plasmid mobilization protein MobA [Pseudomonas sp. CCC3.2]|uniref:plasmid mobilization protein MobA n=1 Tax=unclassified Pseudomonas TaxID=196821 RepID=UPI002AB4D237|nr:MULTISPECIES: plasmid mobilization protein MobA [unclassified Pseudomonas]MDY7562416.1 plasmid mobilization protein MobA [Pseudomonas sp. AB6]MEB0180286.1 plasmid mobilization protein MobA [Pseudomonas sp. CCC3.2]MEB0212377.1 plasmid mobilization protein MobA [Pseudomonas sp. AB6]